MEASAIDENEIWVDAGRLFDAALEKAPEARARFIRSGGPSAKVVDEAISLLTSFEASADFLEPVPDTRAGSMLKQGDRLGAWRIGALIGHGGMGDVYCVQRADGMYDQQAALKHMKALPEDYLPLFASERQFLARLNHPGIARLLDAGVAPDERPWMVMELRQGSRSTSELRSAAPARTKSSA